jgi:penicillin-binding protein 2
MMFGRDDKLSQGRLMAVQYAIVAIFLLLAYGLWNLQVAGTDHYESLAERNRIRTVPILAPRGKIVDRYGRLIVDNYPSSSALLLREGRRELSDQDLDRIAAGLNMTGEQIRERIARYARAPRFQPIFLKDDITHDELAFIEAHRNEFPDLDILMVHRRLYPKDGFLAHLVGYVGEVSEAMLNHPDWELYNPGDIVGRSGVEMYYNEILMGKNGFRRVIVDSLGREVGRLDQTPARPGRQLRLTIDLDLQIAAERAMEGSLGAVVVLDPRTGEVLAMVSRPVFDPNSFAVRISSQEWGRLVNDEDKPLLNKAIQAQVGPGSTFKMIMAVAGMQEGIAQGMRVNCGGGRSFYGRFFRCWSLSRGVVHGEMDLQRAIAQSCNTFFYTLADRLGIARIAHFGHAFGLGSPTHIDLPQEASGVMPSEEWKVRNFKEKWYVGETISVGIGQGAVTITPLQLARAVGGIAMGGVLKRPRVAFREDMPPMFLRMKGEFPDEQRVPIDPRAWELITDGMVDVLRPGGTAAGSRIEGVDWGGKTGTAQVVSLGARARLTGRQFRHNAWFVGVTPRRNPELAIAVLLEQGEAGGNAARVAAEVVRAFAEKQRERREEDLRIAADPKAVEMSAIWNLPPPPAGPADPQPEPMSGLAAGTFPVPLPPAAAYVPAAAAPAAVP